MDRLPPSDQVAMRYDDFRDADRQCAVTHMIGVKEIRLDVFYQRTEIAGSILKILLPFLHPVQTKCSWMILKSMQALHPRCLLRHRNLSEAHQSHAQSAANESGNQFTGVGPDSVQRVGGDKNVHKPATTRAILCWMRVFSKLFLLPQEIAQFLPSRAHPIQSAHVSSDVC